MPNPPLPSFLASPLPPIVKPAPSKKPAKIGRPKGSKSKPKPTPKEPTKKAGKDCSTSAPPPSAIELTGQHSTSGAPLSGAVSASCPSAHLTSAAPTGGEGVCNLPSRENLDKSPLEVEILQSNAATEAGVEAGVDSSSSTAPYREVEGILQSSQANNGNGVKEGVIGVQCRNKWYVEVNVDGVWGKCAKGGMNLFHGEKVKVREVWSSADGVDKEWEVVERVEVPQVYAGMLVEPVGFIGGSAGAALGVKVEQAAEVGEEQPYVPYVHEEKKGDGGDDFLARAREEAIKWAIERAGG